MTCYHRQSYVFFLLLLWIAAYSASIAAEADASSFLTSPRSTPFTSRRHATFLSHKKSTLFSTSVPWRIQQSLRGGGREEQEEETDTTLPQPSKKRRRSALSTPFYLNEVARYEASVAAADAAEEHVIEEVVIEEDADTEDTETISDDKKKTADKDSSGKKKSSRQEQEKRRREEDRRREEERKKRRKKRKKQREKERESTEPAIDVEDDERREALEEVSETLPEAPEISSEKDSKSGDAANLWWVNMWTQQLMDSDVEEEEKEALADVEAELLLESSDNESSSSNSEMETIGDEVTTVVVDTLTPNYTDAVVVEKEKVIERNVESVAVVNGTTTSNTTFTETDPAPLSSSYVSSGVWGPLDNLMTLGLASRYSSLRVSKQLRPLRKWTAHVTGLHGVLSGKPKLATSSTATIEKPNHKDLQGIQRRIAAIDRARKSVDKARAVDEDQNKRRRGLFGLFRGRRNDTAVETTKNVTSDDVEDEEPRVPQRTPEEIEEERRRMERVKEIDRLISEGQDLLQNLICEKDVLQRRPNPLFEYTTVKSTKKKVVADETETADSSSNETRTQDTIVQETVVEVQATRKMNFPPDDLVTEYLEMMVSTRRLVKMNHTYLWQETEVSEDEEETIGDDLFTASADAHRLYQDAGRTRRSREENTKNTNGNGNKNGGGGGSWLLRQSLGGGPSLGEKIGEAAETAAYKAVCAALMSFLAKLLSSLHGINVLKHSDIRLVLEQAPDLPLMGEGVLPGADGNYAEETLKSLMRQKAKKRRKQSKHRFSSDDSFVQRDAVTEMLLSHVQISAPLLKLFPLAWQRALLGNIITLATAVISDFLDGVRFQILGHELSFAFRPITEEDMIRHFQIMSGRLNHRKYKAAEFEAAVRATAEDVSEELKFLDRWHERALGSGVLRTQIANLIARIVLTLTDEILSAARMDLWSAQAGGPRMLAGLEYRMDSIDVEEE